MAHLVCHLPRRGHLGQRWSRLAHWLGQLPPFWTAYVLTLTETVGASILALPIACAGIGPIAGVVILVVLGLVNILTIISIVEAITRNGNMRYGFSYFGQLVEDYLGKPGMVILSVSLWLMLVLSLMICYIGVATTLAAATPIPATIWAAVMFGIGCCFLQRESLTATKAAALVIGVINIGMILILALLAVPHIRLANLVYINIPLINGQPFQPTVLTLVFGVVLGGYFGHTSAANAAKEVLRRDPSGTTLLWGNIAAMLTTMGLYAVWVVAVNGAIPPAVLVSTTGTALTPLAAVVGPVVFVPGTIFVILGMGMLTVHFSWGLFNQAREWLPTPVPLEISGACCTVVRTIHRRLTSRLARYLVGMTPVALVFVWVEWLLVTGQESFIAPMAVTGTITAPVIGGIFPVLMLAASRRKGEYSPGWVWRGVGHPLVIGAIYLIFVSSLLVYGLAIWSAPLPRLGAVLAAAAVLGLTVVLLRQGAFVPRTIVELRISAQRNELTMFSIMSAGNPLPTEVTLTYPDSERQLWAASGIVGDAHTLRGMRVHLPPLLAKELKVWVHQVTPDASSEAVPAQVVIRQGSGQHVFDLAQAGVPLLVSAHNDACQVEIRLSEAPRPRADSGGTSPTRGG